MKPFELQKVLSAIELDLEKHFLPEEFVGEGDNEQIDNQYQMNKRMSRFLIAAAMNTRFDKEYKTLKHELDYWSRVLQCEADVDNGEMLEIYSDNVFRFVKKRLKETSTLATKDLVLELLKLGVDANTIDVAKSLATKPRNGNMYYIVEILDD